MIGFDEFGKLIIIPGEGGGGGAVTSVNDQVGDVVLGATDVGALAVTGGTVTGDLKTTGNITSAGDSVTTVTATSGTVTIPAESGHIYLYTAVDSDVITFATPSSGDAPEFEIDLRQPATAVSFSWGQSITWRFGVPTLSTAGALYQLKFRYVDGVWEGWTTPDMSEYVKYTDYPTFKYNAGRVTYTPGVVNVDYGQIGGLFQAAGNKHILRIVMAASGSIDGRVSNNYFDSGTYGANKCYPIVPARVDYAVKKCLCDCKLTGSEVWTDAERIAALELLKALSVFGDKITALDSTTISAIPAVEGVVYTYTLTGSETITFGTPTSGYMPTFELHLTQPSTVVSFSWGSTIWWDDGTGSFSSSSTPPDFSTADTIYCVVLRYANSHWLGNLAYTEEVDDSSSSSGA